jgi:hypothetical protein
MYTLETAQKMSDDLYQYAEDLIKQEAMALLEKYPEQLTDYTASMGGAYFNFTAEFAAMVRQNSLSPSDYWNYDGHPTRFTNRPLTDRGYNDDYYEPEDANRIEVSDELFEVMDKLEDDVYIFFELVTDLTNKCSISGLYHGIKVYRD